MPHRRASGILLHATSLPGRFGIGDLGPALARLVAELGPPAIHIVAVDRSVARVPLGILLVDCSPQFLEVRAGRSFIKQRPVKNWRERFVAFLRQVNAVDR